MFNAMLSNTCGNAVVQHEVYPVLFLKMEELKADHEAMKLELESSHTEQLQCVKQQYEMSLEGEWTGLDQMT